MPKDNQGQSRPQANNQQQQQKKQPDTDSTGADKQTKVVPTSDSVGDQQQQRPKKEKAKKTAQAPVQKADDQQQPPQQGADTPGVGEVPTKKVVATSVGDQQPPQIAKTQAQDDDSDDDEEEEVVLTLKQRRRLYIAEAISRRTKGQFGLGRGGRKIVPLEDNPTEPIPTQEEIYAEIEKIAKERGNEIKAARIERRGRRGIARRFKELKESHKDLKLKFEVFRNLAESQISALQAAIAALQAEISNNKD